MKVGLERLILRAPLDIYPSQGNLARSRHWPCVPADRQLSHCVVSVIWL